MNANQTIAVTEQVAAEFDIEIVKLTPEQKQEKRLNAWRKWGNGMTMLRAIHNEIEPKLQALREARLDIYDEKFHVNEEPTKAEIMALDNEIAESK